MDRPLEDPTTPIEMEPQLLRVRRQTARATGATCALCAAPFAPAAPVWLLLWDGAPACEPCAERALYSSHRYRLSAPCRGCGRPLYQLQGSFRRLECSHRCRTVAYNRRRRAAAAAKREVLCVTCGQPFTPPRASSRYCSNACRQRAYRQRRASH
jgi:hypothetical protein